MAVCFCGLPHNVGRRFLIATAVAVAATPAWAETAPASAGPADPALIEDLVAANRILYEQGVVDGFGHVSARHDKDPDRYLLSRSMAPALVTADDIMEYDLDSTPADPRGRTSYLERFIHGEIYKARPDVLAVVHSHSPAVIPFADTKVVLRPMNHIAGFLGGGVPRCSRSATPAVPPPTC
jgi:HCOMODA/2-hydroxy-3-carboxy-muconic semialdehyde decarboxylase